MTRPPVIFWRYTFAEVMRLVLVTSLILVTVTSFATAVRWFADGKLGPLDILRFMAFALLPMLAYVLPFAACFGSTLTYHRLVQDNELVACHVGGMSHRSVLAPALGVALALALVLGVLNDRAIPWFLKRMESMITLDLTRVMVNSIERGEAMRFDNYLINAESVTVLDPQARPEYHDAGVIQWVLFRRLIMLEFNKAGELVREVTSREGQFLVFPGTREDADSNIAMFRLTDWATKDEDVATNASKGWSPTIELPNAFRDDPKYMSASEMRELRKDPERIDEIRSNKIDLAYHLGERVTTDEIARRLRDLGRVEFESPRGEMIVMHASRMDWDHASDGWVVSAPAGSETVRIETLIEGRSPTVQNAGRVVLNTDIGLDPKLRELTVTLTMEDVRTAFGDGGPVSDRRTLTATKLALVDSPIPELLKKSALELLAIAEPLITRPDPDRFVMNPAGDLKENLEKLGREITSKRHERWAMSASCFVMVLCGALSAIRLRDAQPLSVYLWCFFPAIVAVISIASGQSVTHKTGLGGLAILWGGVVALGIYTLIIYRIVRRH